MDLQEADRANGMPQAERVNCGCQTGLHRDGHCLPGLLIDCRQATSLRPLAHLHATCSSWMYCQWQRDIHSRK